MDTFTDLKVATIDRYGSWLDRLLVNVIRCARAWDNPYTFNLTAQHITNCQRVFTGLEHEVDATIMLSLIHTLALSLWAHIKPSHKQDKYYSPINAFIALASVKPNGEIKQGSDISQIIAALMYSGRTVLLWEMELLASQQDISMHQYVLSLSLRSPRAYGLHL